MKQDCAIADNVEAILLAQLENAIENAYLASLHNVAHGFAGRSVLDVLTELYGLFGSISAQKVNTMLHKMTDHVDPNAPISIAFKQIDDAAKYIAASGRAVAPNTIVNAAETVLMQTGRYNDAFRRWIPQDPTQKTYHHLKNFFPDEYRLLNQLQETTQGAGYNVNPWDPPCPRLCCRQCQRPSRIRDHHEFQCDACPTTLCSHARPTSHAGTNGPATAAVLHGSNGQQ
jgi:hypothetical protein